MLNNTKKSNRLTIVVIFTSFFLIGTFFVNNAFIFESTNDTQYDIDNPLDTEIPLYEEHPTTEMEADPIDFRGELIREPVYDRSKIDWRPIEETLNNLQTNNDIDEGGISTASFDVNTRIETVTSPRFSPSSETSSKLSIVEPYAGLLPGLYDAESVIGGDGRTVVSNQAVFPWRTIVKLYISASDGSNWVGSGAIIDNFHVLTAGHTAFLPDNGGWASSIEVVPAMDTSDIPSDPYGHAWVTNMRSYTGWTVSESPQHDWAVLTLDRNVGIYTGWMGRTTAGSSSSIYTDTMNVAGYPTDLSSGNRMYFDSDLGDGATSNNHYYWADTAGGMSGGPVWRLTGGNRYIMTVHAYGRDGLDSNYGTRLNSDKYDRIFTWLGEDSAPTDRPDMEDRGSTWHSATSGTITAGVTSFTVSNDVRNVGTTSTGGFWVHYYASTNNFISTSD
jgi:V8-like Glu-specific endopeptidase